MTNAILAKPSRRAEDVVIPKFVSDEADDQLEGIRCPRCNWRPTNSDRWSCYAVDTPEPPFEYCLTMWNTFETHGRCPGCQHQWMWTSCLRCSEWSLHEDWYERRPSQH